MGCSTYEIALDVVVATMPIVVIQSSARTIVAEVINERDVTRQCLKIARSLLSVHSDLVYVVATNHNTIWVCRRGCEDSIGRAKGGDGRVSRIDELILKDGRVRDIVREHQSVATGLIESAPVDRNIARVLNEHGCSTMDAPIT